MAKRFTTPELAKIILQLEHQAAVAFMLGQEREAERCAEMAKLLVAEEMLEREKEKSNEPH